MGSCMLGGDHGPRWMIFLAALAVWRPAQEHGNGIVTVKKEDTWTHSENGTGIKKARMDNLDSTDHGAVYGENHIPTKTVKEEVKEEGLVKSGDQVPDTSMDAKVEQLSGGDNEEDEDTYEDDDDEENEDEDDNPDEDKEFGTTPQNKIGFAAGVSVVCRVTYGRGKRGEEERCRVERVSCGMQGGL
ncbi:hypothetical protein HDV00_002972 [Rhizophlyctis rosea]|nr:hypothetical protein HDV00_002972 [Rhizophlyctis rosea]